MQRDVNALLSEVLAFAQGDERVRAAVLSGSLVRGSALPDPLQDVDLTFYVQDLSSFTRDHTWVDVLGERAIMQTPTLMGARAYDHASPFTYLMQFTDGTRLDLTLIPAARLAGFPPESQSRVLLDRDGLLTDLPAPSDREFIPARPTEATFQDSCNEFLWLAPYVAKGLWRGQIGYAKYHLDTLMRGELLRMLDWAFATRTHFTHSPGKFGRNYPGVLPDEWLSALPRTYAGADEAENWEALQVMMGVFREAAREVAEYAGFTYPAQDDERITAHVQRVQELPKSSST